MKKKVKCPVKRPASSDEDSDMERNFTLFERQETKTDDQHERREEEEEEEESAEEGEESAADEEDDPEEGEESAEEEDDSEEREESNEDTNLEEEEDDVEDKGDDELRTREDVQKELSHMSFEDVLKLQNKVGTKVYNKVKHNSCSGPEPSEKRKRLNKNRPMEVSAKRPVQFLRQVVSAKKSTLRDPRFDDLSGEYKADIFEKTYSFINDIKLREKEIIKKKLKKAKSERKKEKLQFLVKRMENQERARLSHEHQRNRELELKRKQRERASQGQAPLFLKNSERKKLQLLEKYQDLKRSGKLENFLTKKRKRNAAKDRRKLPPKQHSNAPRGFHGPH
ncbi:hypothetical protein NQD34_000048 [Periophthalmus magnuspinnatus]|nr:hypothetical protein NQD34_000048 [Periophthalmus magnuspinnatus]